MKDLNLDNKTKILLKIAIIMYIISMIVGLFIK